MPRTMIIVRAPLRISFAGGGTDLPDFYHTTPGKVISATIDKFVYIAINPAPLLTGITARYAITETVSDIRKLKNNRIREAMIHFNINDNMEIGIFSQMPVGTGLGGSSSFTVALIKGFSTYLGKRLNREDIAELASKIEINILKEPIGKQDQYAASFGGLNVFQFNSNDTVNVDPVLIDYKRRIDLENHLLMFFTGITREASSILIEQKVNTVKKIETLSNMAKMVESFKKNLIKGDFQELGNILHENWLKKKSLASKISNQIIDNLYEVGLNNGAWGGKILGAGGGGCILFIAPLNKRNKIISAVEQTAQKFKLQEFKEVPIKLVQCGVEIISNSTLNS